MQQFHGKAAAALAGQKVQDYVSDVMNEHASKQLGKKPARRRTPPERKPRAD